MNQDFALLGCPIFDGNEFRDRQALLVRDGQITGLLPEGDLPRTLDQQRLSNGFLTPGFVDLQVNGGGGVLLNDDPSPEAIATICAAHL